jgi:hypothetical protein
VILHAEYLSLKEIKARGLNMMNKISYILDRIHVIPDF